MVASSPSLKSILGIGDLAALGLIALVCAASPSYSGENSNAQRKSDDPVSWSDIEEWVTTDLPPAPETENQPASNKTPIAGVKNVKPLQIPQANEAKEARILFDRIAQLHTPRYANNMNKDHEKAAMAAYKLGEFKAAQKHFGMIYNRGKQKEGNWKWEFENGWVEKFLWQSSLWAIRQPLSRKKIEGFFAEYKEKIEKIAPDPGDENWRIKKSWRRWEKWKVEERKRQEKIVPYFEQTKGKILEDEFLKLENDGIKNPDQLWKAIKMFLDRTLENDRRLALNLYRMRHWHENHEAVKEGTVQWELVEVLNEGLELHDLAAKEADEMINKFPDHRRVRSGDATYELAENLYDYGNRLKSGNRIHKKQARDVFKKSKTHFEILKSKYRKHWANRVNDHGDGKRYSEAQRRIYEINKSLKEGQGR